ncbi:DUF2029 domain-containing protein [Corynebacterium sp.]|uniref:DUF2029 domain-containing protein n=1 Tax=Corynebacterium sp. TaxID=1720 RepID=UPI0019B6E4B1|nr:DUF2029 domain-containing protein [Corynebacterium sp.]HHU67193.1 DUF2029 domain-containing protein [Corynebacterium sp.]
MHRTLSVPVVWLGWIVSRLLLLRLILAEPMPFGDVRYYYRGVSGADPTALTEYPDAGVWPVRLLGWLTGLEGLAFVVGFLAMNALLDAAVLALLLRRGERRFTAGWFWVFFGLATGHVLWLRLDLVPGVLVAGTAALLFTRPAVGAAVLAAAAAVKLWPAVLAAGLVGGLRRSGTWVRVGSFLLSLVGLAGVTWVTAGSGRLLSPLSYQGDRGIQIESVAATPFLLRAHGDPEAYWMGYAASKSYEIHGPGTDLAVRAADVALYAVLAFALGWAVWQLFADRWRPRTAVAFLLLLVLLLMVANKVFSPQYIVWVGPLLAVCLRVSGSRLVAWTAGLAVVAAALGLYVYPYHYDELWYSPGTAGVEIAVLAVRNLLIVVMTVLTAAWLAREVRLSGRPAPDAPGRERSRRASSATSTRRQR